MAQLSTGSAEQGTIRQAITEEVIARFADTPDERLPNPVRALTRHVIAKAPGHVTVTTHFFDDRSSYLKTDAVVGVRPSLICHFESHGRGGPGVTEGWHGRWYTLERGVGLARDEAWRS
jgi:hypothetical protein